MKCEGSADHCVKCEAGHELVKVMQEEEDLGFTLYKCMPWQLRYPQYESDKLYNHIDEELEQNFMAVYQEEEEDLLQDVGHHLDDGFCP